MVISTSSFQKTGKSGMMGDAMCPEVEEYLIEQGRLELHKEDPEHYFQGTGWGTKLTASSDAVLVFYEIKRKCPVEISWMLSLTL